MSALEAVRTDRMCHNCGREQSHRVHEVYGSECAYFLAQPETLWTAVVQPALWRAAEENGLDSGDVWGAAWDHFRSQMGLR